MQWCKEHRLTHERDRLFTYLRIKQQVIARALLCRRLACTVLSHWSVLLFPLSLSRSARLGRCAPIFLLSAARIPKALGSSPPSFCRALFARRSTRPTTPQSASRTAANADQSRSRATPQLQFKRKMKTSSEWDHARVATVKRCLWFIRSIGCRRSRSIKTVNVAKVQIKTDLKKIPIRISR